MTAEDAFWQALEADPADTDTRLIFADWLEDQGRSVEAKGQRWQVRNRQWPHWSEATGGSWDWWGSIGRIPDCDFELDRVHAVLPEDVWNALRAWTWQGIHYAEYPALRDAETALAYALASLDL